MAYLSQEIQSILQEAREGHLGEAESSEPCLDVSGQPCWYLQEAVQFVAEDIAEATGLDPEVLSAVLVEVIACNEECRQKYTEQDDGSCVKYAEDCCTGVKDPEAFCAYIGRRLAGKV